MFLWNIAVTSLVEVWIEIFDPAGNITCRVTSLPLRKCGLKLNSPTIFGMNGSHFPCGSVD